MQALMRVHVAHLEGMAAIGLVDTIKIEECKGKLVKIVAKLSSGDTVETRCLDPGAVELVQRCLAELKALSLILIEKSD